jgi:hypothetical protein
MVALLLVTWLGLTLYGLGTSLGPYEESKEKVGVCPTCKRRWVVRA